MAVRNFSRCVILISSLLALAACTSAGRTVSTFDGPAYKGPAFRNLLVIGIAGSYDSRVMFERELAKEIRSGGAGATALYTLVTIDTPIDRPTVEKILAEGDYDAVLVTRAVNSDVGSSVKSGTSTAKAKRKDGSAANLFRYDYEELNEPDTLVLELKVVIASELYAAKSQERVWSIEADISDQSSVGVLVDDASQVVASRLRKDGLIPK